MKLYHTKKGILVEKNQVFSLIKEDWDVLFKQDNLIEFVAQSSAEAVANHEELLKELLPTTVSQEIWATGVTYYKSREARMDESKDAGGGDFYDRVYNADRPELFFKSSPQRAVGSGQEVNIRKDSKWNVPEPELTLAINSKGKIIGYTIGNDMSSRDIEGENPLYLPQAKSYDKAAAVGPCIYVSEQALDQNVMITLEINRQGVNQFTDSIAINQIKRKLTDLVHYLYLEMTFPNGALLMTGTGIVPSDDFTLEQGDEIKITIDQIGTLINTVA